MFGTCRRTCIPAYKQSEFFSLDDGPSPFTAGLFPQASIVTSLAHWNPLWRSVQANVEKSFRDINPGIFQHSYSINNIHFDSICFIMNKDHGSVSGLNSGECFKAVGRKLKTSQRPTLILFLVLASRNLQTDRDLDFRTGNYPSPNDCTY